MKRLVLCWHRRAGKDKTCLAATIIQMHKRRGAYYHLFPTAAQGRKALWLGIGKDGFKYMDHFPKQLVKRINDQEMTITLKNGSIYQIIGTDKGLDYLRGTNPVGLIFSEYSRMNPSVWDTMRPILRENDGWAIFPYTPWGENHGYRLYEMAVKNEEWFASKLTVDDTQDNNGNAIVTPEDVEEEIQSGMSLEMSKQEFYCNFHSVLPGAIFSQELMAAEEQGRIGEVPYHAELPVFTSWDLGIKDSSAVWFYQLISNEVRFIDYYEASGQSLADIIDVVKSKPYQYGEHFAPHDIKVREFSTGRSRVDFASRFGINFTATPKVSDKGEALDAAKRLLKICWFDRENCKEGLAALRNYHRGFNAANRVFSDKPVHSWASHGSDAFLLVGINYWPEGTLDMNSQTQADMSFDVYTNETWTEGLWSPFAET